jgi:phosphoglycerate kinase
MSKLTLKDLNVKNKKVLMRVDFNVPLDENGQITDATRIIATLDSIDYLLKHGASLVLMSHLGRPDGKRNLDFTLRPCAQKLSELLNQPVLFAEDCMGEKTKELIENLKSNQIILLENLRFYEAEEEPEKDPLFAKTLATYGDLFVNDAFAAAHRAHSSTAITPRYFKEAAMGFLVEKEVKYLSETLKNPKRPFYAIIGGAKVSSKIKVLFSLLDKVDALFIGGAMAFTFLKVQGYEIGDSKCENGFLDEAKKFLEKSKEKKTSIYLPEDLIVASSLDSPCKRVDVKNNIEAGWQGFDLGEKTISKWKDILKNAKTIFWNGPVGVFEKKAFCTGTFDLAKFLSTLTCITIVGGGDSVCAISNLNLTKKFSHVSTGGGASLELIENDVLPGIEALTERK